MRRNYIEEELHEGIMSHFSPPKKKKCRRGPSVIYSKEKTFETFQMAMEFVQKEHCWSIRTRTDTSDGHKIYFRCNAVTKQGQQCPALIYLCTHTDTDQDSTILFRNDQDHDHREKIRARGISVDVKKLIEELYEQGVTKPKAILAELRKKDLDVSSYDQLINFLQAYKEKNHPGIRDKPLPEMPLSTDQKLVIVRLIEENKTILFAKSSKTVTHDSKVKTWKDIVQKCRHDYGFDPVPPEKDWKYLRDTTWKNWKNSAKKKSDAEGTEIDLAVLSILGTADSTGMDDQDMLNMPEGDSASIIPLPVRSERNGELFQRETAGNFPRTFPPSSSGQKDRGCVIGIPDTQDPNIVVGLMIARELGTFPMDRQAYMRHRVRMAIDQVIAEEFERAAFAMNNN